MDHLSEVICSELDWYNYFKVRRRKKERKKERKWGSF
jgi:hypothetical protein